VYFPRAFSPADAERVSLAAGDDRSGADLVLARLRTVSVEGLLSGTEASDPIGITMTQSGPALPMAAARPLLQGRPSGDGPFRFRGVTPGRWTVRALSSTRPIRFAEVTLDVVGGDVRGVALVMQPALRLAGQLKFDRGRLTPPDPAAIRVSLEAASTRAASGAGGRGIPVGGPTEAATTDARGNFVVDGIVPGTYRLTATLPASATGWWLSSAVVNGRDVLDEPLRIDAATSLTGAVLTFSDRHTRLSGLVDVPAGQTAASYFIVAFPQDRTLWLPYARRIRFTRPGTDGMYVLRDLPPGAYRLAVVTDLGPDELVDPAFFEAIVPFSIGLTLADGEEKSQSLRVGR
jgi:hypothetical protein